MRADTILILAVCGVDHLEAIYADRLDLPGRFDILTYNSGKCGIASSRIVAIY